MRRSRRRNNRAQSTATNSSKNPTSTATEMDQTNKKIMEMMKTQMEELKTNLLETVRNEIKTSMTLMTQQMQEATHSLEEAHNRIEDLQKDKCDLEKKVEGLKDELLKCKQKETSLTSRLDRLEERQIASESYSKRDNLLFYGITQKQDENCLTEVKQFMIDYLEIPSVVAETIKVQRCHRMNMNLNPKPIVCRFLYFPDRMLVWNARRRLQDTPYSLSEDFPPEIVARRKMLYPIFKAAQRDKKRTRLIGDKLEIEGKFFTVKTSNTLPSKYDPAKLATREKNGVTAFFTKASPLSNFHPCDLEIDGTKYLCVEQFFQEQRAHFGGKPEIAAQIRSTIDPAKCKSLGQSVAICEDDWLPTALQVMRRACWEKFSKNVALKEVLLGTKETVIAEASLDKTWGVGRTLNDPKVHTQNDFQGQNKLGEILMDLRKQLET